jgi:hypothetical protein
MRRETQPYYWLAANQNNKDKKKNQKLIEREKESLKEKTNIKGL